jgi:hypothetical protein
MAISRNILFYQGANSVMQSLVSNSDGNPVDLTEFEISGKIKKHHGSANIISFSCTGYANGIILCTLDSQTTANMDAGRYVYNVDITENSTNNTIRVQHGLLVLKPSVQ